jgi:hypothetical protein
MNTRWGENLDISSAGGKNSLPRPQKKARISGLSEQQMINLTNR